MHGILIAPAAFRAAGNALGNALGHGPDTYSVPLYPVSIPADEPTHYGACSPVTADFVSLVHGAEQGIIPPELKSLGYTGAEVQALIQQLTIDFSSIVEDGATHFYRVIALAGFSQQPFFAE